MPLFHLFDAVSKNSTGLHSSAFPGSETVTLSINVAGRLLRQVSLTSQR